MSAYSSFDATKGEEPKGKEPKEAAEGIPDETDFDIVEEVPAATGNSQGEATGNSQGEAKDGEPESDFLWLGRSPAEAKPDGAKTDGILVVPYSKGSVCSKTPICWYFVLDTSGSMNYTVHGKAATRWDISVQLFSKVLADLKNSGRKDSTHGVEVPKDSGSNDDTVTIITFNRAPKVLCTNATIDEVVTPAFMKSLVDIKPDYNTNIQLVNSVVHTLMTKNPLLIAKTHRAAEIFFTDGEATEGFTRLEDLQKQKTDLYKNIGTHLGTTPFLWCGAISDAAKWQIVRGMSLASPLSMWAYIKDTEMENFAGEVGGVVTTIIHMRTFNLPPAHKDGQPRQVILLPDTDGMFYCQQKEWNCPQVEGSALVTLFKIKLLLEEHSTGRRVLTHSDVTECLERAKQRQKTDDPFINTSIKWSTVFERTKQEVLRDLEELLDNFTRGTFELTRQVSDTRHMFSRCAITSQASAMYKGAYTKF